MNENNDFKGLTPLTVLKHGDYVIGSVLGVGGFGITYEAEQVSLGRTVAVKEFFMKDICNRDAGTSAVSVPSVGSQELVGKFKAKFLREARMIASFDHAHIVRIYDVFEENGTAYYVMENLSGGSLSEKVKSEGPLSEAVAEKYIRQVADALEYIHSRGTVHLDVKPSNILLNTKGEAVLIDFGISKHYDKGGEQTSSTPVGISKGYAPLEQGRDGDVSQFTPATDIYALGATLYYLVTGQVPPEASFVYEDGLVRPKGISDCVWQAIETAMQPRRKDRPQSVAAFLSLLSAGGEISPLASLGRNANSETQEGDVTVISDKESPAISSDDSPVISSEVEKSKGDIRPVTSSKKVWLYGVIGTVVALLIGLLFFLPESKEKELAMPESKEIELATPSLSGYENGHEWVDLGLSVKWATCNIGAKKPGDYGGYFAWGETTPKTDYQWYNYQYSDDSYNNLTKYNITSSYGVVDNMTVLEYTDDAARQNWIGRWRMPTDEEWTELRENCRWDWTTQDGHNGFEVTGPNGESIFLPAAGYRDDKIRHETDGFYWSSCLQASVPFAAWMVNFYWSYSRGIRRYYHPRNSGLSVRPVLE